MITLYYSIDTFCSSITHVQEACGVQGGRVHIQGVQRGKGGTKNQAFSSASVISMLSPCAHRILTSSRCCASCSGVAFRAHVSSLWNPFAAQRNRPPAEYCAIEYLVSPSLIEVFECLIKAEGIRMVDPGGKRIMGFRSQRTMCPPRSGL